MQKKLELKNILNKYKNEFNDMLHQPILISCSVADVLELSD